MGVPFLPSPNGALGGPARRGGKKSTAAQGFCLRYRTRRPPVVTVTLFGPLS